jgi:hypothetical protein
LLNPRWVALALVAMKQNVGLADRIFRALGGLAMLSCSVMAPLPLIVRAGVLGVLGGYLLLTALASRCGGYALLGKSTCAVEVRR